MFEELSILIANDLEDPRLNLAAVTRVEISKDLRNARVFVNHLDETVTRRDLLKGFQHATPYLRGQIAERCGLRLVPELSFTYDDTPETAARVDELLKQIAAERLNSPSPASEDSPSQG